MGHRHFTNTFDMFGINQGHNHNHSSAEQSYVPPGGAVPTENISFVSPMDNMSRSGGNCDSHWNSEGRANEYSSSNFSMQVQHLPPPFSTRPYDPYPHSSVSRNLYPAQPINAPLVHSSYYNRPTTHDVEVGLLDPTTTTVRGAYKRKSPSFNGACERGGTNRFSDAGSSSSSQLLLENPTSDYQSIPLPGPIGLAAQYGGSSSLSVPGEDSMRNVRSRSGLYIEPNTTRTHLPTYPSHHYHSTTLPRNPSNMVNLGNLSADVTSREWTHVPLSATSHGRLPTSDANGSSYETNRFVVGGSTADIGSCPRDYISSGPPVSSSQYLHGPHAQATREGSSYHSLRATPSYRTTSLSYSHLGHEAAASMDNGLHSHSESFSSRYSRTASAGGLRNSYRNGRSRIAVDRLQSISSSEFLMAGDRSPIYDGSRASYDQYRDMRLDVDSMSYEELLALGERIGDVSTGVSEDLMSNCLVEKVHCSSDQNHMEENCAICLEEYKAGEGIGTLKNCGHGYHVGCIRKWLMMKNVCPICKADALKDC